MEKINKTIPCSRSGSERIMFITVGSIKIMVYGIVLLLLDEKLQLWIRTILLRVKLGKTQKQAANSDKCPQRSLKDETQLSQVYS